MASLNNYIIKHYLYSDIKTKLFNDEAIKINV